LAAFAGRVAAAGLLTGWLGRFFATSFLFGLVEVLLGSVLAFGKLGLVELGLLAAYGLAVAGL
jgi:hypothetical protein